MGTRIDDYTRADLERMSLTGKAVSALFWVIPTGRWNSRASDAMWSFFTRDAPESLCHRVGLFVARTFRHESDGVHACRDEDQPAANLSDLIPQVSMLPPETRKRFERTAGLLVASAAYPQPGWGLYLPLPRGFTPGRLEALVAAAVSGIGAEYVAPIERAAVAHRTVEELDRSEPGKPEPHADAAAFRALREAYADVFAALEGHRARDVMGALERWQKTLKPAGVQSAGDPDVLQGLFRHLRSLDRLLAEFGDDPARAGRWLAEFSRVDEHGRAAAIAEAVNRDRREGYFLKAFECLQAAHRHVTADDLREFVAAPYFDWIAHEVRNHLAAGARQVRDHLAKLEEDHAVEITRYDSRMQVWREQIQAATARYRQCVPDCVRAQIEGGPRFLIELEARCRGAGWGDVVPYAWDQPRMVGWRLHVAVPTLKPGALLNAAARAGGPMPRHDAGQARPEAFSGSLFADYAHAIVIGDDKASPRGATKRLMHELLGANHLYELSTAIGGGGGPAPVAGNDEAEHVLAAWGWPPDPPWAARSLSEQLVTRAGGVTLARTINDARSSVESFCKDVLRVCFRNLGWRDDELSRQVSVHCPHYRQGLRGGSFSERVDTLTLEPLLILMETLVPLAFPEAGDRPRKLHEVLTGIKKPLNEQSHDNPALPWATPGEHEGIAGGIAEVLRLAHEIVMEMPWHLTVKTVVGREPAVVSGTAWSHSHAAEHTIFVCLSGHQAKRDRMLVWNPSRINPVMTEAKILG